MDVDNPYYCSVKIITRYTNYWKFNYSQFREKTPGFCPSLFQSRQFEAPKTLLRELSGNNEQPHRFKYAVCFLQKTLTLVRIIGVNMYRRLFTCWNLFWYTSANSGINHVRSPYLVNVTVETRKLCQCNTDCWLKFVHNFSVLPGHLTTGVSRLLFGKLFILDTLSSSSCMMLWLRCGFLPF